MFCRKNLSDKAAKNLSKHKVELNLNGLTSLSDKSAESHRYRSDNKRWAIKESLLV